MCQVALPVPIFPDFMSFFHDIYCKTGFQNLFTLIFPVFSGSVYSAIFPGKF